MRQHRLRKRSAARSRPLTEGCNSPKGSGRLRPAAGPNMNRTFAGRAASETRASPPCIEPYLKKTTMKTYLIRSVKYFCALCVLCAILMAAMLATGTSQLTAEETLHLLFHSDRFVLLGVAIVVLSATYPRFGFVRRRVEGDLVRHRTQIETAFRQAGLRLVSATDDELRFRGDGFVRRASLLFEDEVRVTQYGQWIEIDGIRRVVVRVAYRLEGYVETLQRNEK